MPLREIAQPAGNAAGERRGRASERSVGSGPTAATGPFRSSVQDLLQLECPIWPAGAPAAGGTPGTLLTASLRALKARWRRRRSPRPVTGRLIVSPVRGTKVAPEKKRPRQAKWYGYNVRVDFTSFATATGDARSGIRLARSSSSFRHPSRTRSGTRQRWGNSSGRRSRQHHVQWPRQFLGSRA